MAASMSGIDPSSGERVTNEYPEVKLEFEPMTGKLRVVNRASSASNVICTDMASVGFGGPLFRVPRTKDELVIIPNSCDRERVYVKTMHISCQSDTYKPDRNYGGVIIYLYNGKSDWRTANNTHCKTGYIVIQDTDSKNVKKWKSKEPGAVHGAVYRNAFGESVKEAEVVGEGFAVRNEKLKITSSVFNNPPNSVFHDFDRNMHKLSEHCLRKVVEYWKTACPRWVRQRNFDIKQLLEDFIDIEIDDTL